ncbi:MAG TPA: hypothetical protein ENK18_23870 [Deltaproteobacteria bacterium]|nr:hypothetical protein [Deltaproteobacteria bacterium]
MGIRDSRDKFKTPRWGVPDGGDVLAPGVAEPPGVKKDTGWIPGVDTPNILWWNWLHNQTSIFLEYLERLWSRLWADNHLPRNQPAGAGLVTAGTGLSVDVAPAGSFIEGAVYEVAAVTGLALTAADPTHGRWDLIVSQLSSGVPEYAVVTGTPAATPTVPTPTSSQTVHARVKVDAAATTPSLIQDVREFGALSVDTARVDKALLAGEVGGPFPLVFLDGGLQQLRLGSAAAALFEVLNLSSLVRIGGDLLQVNTASNTLILDGGKTRFSTPEEGLYDLPFSDFLPNDAGNPSNNGVKWDLTSNDFLTAAVRVPNGATITQARLYVDLPTGAQVRFALVRPVKGTVNTAPIVATIHSPVGGGQQTITLSGLSQPVTQGGFYRVTVLALAGSPSIQGADVRYEIESNAFGLL